MKKTLTCVAVSLLVFVIGCPENIFPPQPPPRPAPSETDATPPLSEAGLEASNEGDASDESDAPTACALACVALTLAGCPLGSEPECAAVLWRDLSTGQVTDLVGHPISCDDVKKVRTASDAHELGFSCR